LILKKGYPPQKTRMATEMNKESIESLVKTLKKDSDIYKLLTAIIEKQDEPDLDINGKRRVREEMKKLCGHTIRSLKALYRDPVPTYIEYLVTDEVKEWDINKYTIDPIYKDALSEYDIYVRPGYEQYPFIKILIDDKVLAYSIYRYIGELPFYVSVDKNKKIPTVDHISRNAYDNTRGNLRYCTAGSNSVNKCRVKNNKNRYHGMEGSSITEGGKVDMKVLIWCLMFDTYLKDKKEEFKEEDLKHISMTACKTKDTLEYFQDHAMIMDRFVDEMQRIPSIGIYDKETSRNDIPIIAIKTAGLELLCKIWKSYPRKNHPIYQFKVHHDHVGALYYDITRYERNGEFAHLNLIKAKPSTGMDIPERIMTPIEVLNKYEQEQDPLYLDDYHSRLGLVVDAGKIKKYEKEGRSIRARWSNRAVDYQSFLKKHGDEKMTNEMYYEVGQVDVEHGIKNL